MALGIGHWLTKDRRSTRRLADLPVETDPVLAERIANLSRIERGAPSLAERSLETRAAARFVPRRRITVLTTKSGKKLDANIINLSVHGVAVEADVSKAQGDEVYLVGTRRVERGRRIMRGMVYLFETPLDSASCGPDLVL